MQMLYFLEQRKLRMPGMQHVHIVFATPVYLWNVPIAQKRDSLAAEQSQLTQLRNHFAVVSAKLLAVWRERRPVTIGLENLFREVRPEFLAMAFCPGSSYRMEIEEEFDRAMLSELEVGVLVTKALQKLVNEAKQRNGQATPEQWGQFDTKPALKQSWN